MYILYSGFHLISEMRKFFVDRATIEDVNIVQPETELEHSKGACNVLCT